MIADTVDVRRYQERLAELGIYRGRIDGIKGWRTRNAVRGFQRIHGLRVDGIVGSKTEAELWPETILGRDVLTDMSSSGSNDWPFEREALQYFGNPGENHAMLDLPFSMKLAWDKRIWIKRFSIHEKVHDSARRCFDRVADAYSDSQRADLGINLFGGCYANRKKRGGSTWSMHAFAAAIDFDPFRNRLRWGRDRARLAKPDADVFWRIWEEEGWVSLGRARNFDWMHIQAARP